MSSDAERVGPSFSNSFLVSSKKSVKAVAHSFFENPLRYSMISCPR